ncbi:MAG: hypothetical protein ACK5P5_02255 [Pseudobdellovibrionaceae bacterium]
MINKITLASLFTPIFFSISLFGAQIINIKGTKTLIDLQSTDAKPGDEFYGMNAENKRKVILKINQVKNGKAVAEIVKGTAEVGFTLQPRTGGPAPSSSTAAPKKRSVKKESEDSSYTSLKSNRGAWGVVANVLMNSMSASFTGTNASKVTADLKGNSFGVNALYDYPLSKKFHIRGLGGYDQYSLTGTTANNDCDSSTTCTVNVNYLSGYGIAKYHLMTNDTRLWLGGGLGYLFAISKSSSILRTSEITSNLLYVVSLGADIQMGRKNFLPVQFDYGIFPSSDTVKATSMFIRFGWAWDL